MADTETLIYAVTHGDKFSGRANPGMTNEGFCQIQNLFKHFVIANPGEIVCGTGKRHKDIAVALDIEPSRYTPVLGTPDSLEIVNGKKMIVLADGTAIEPEKYTAVVDMEDAAKKLIASLPTNSIICVGRPAIMMLGHADAKSVAVYGITCENGCVLSIQEIVASGQSEKDTV